MSQKRTKTKRKNQPAAAVATAGSGARSWPALRWDFLCWCGLLLAGALLYGHTLNAPWYLDDTNNIVENLKIRDLSLALERLFAPRGPAIFSFAVNYALTGLSRPGFHITNIAIHVIASGLVYLVAKRVFPDRRVLAMLAAAIFLAHPLQTQAVTYIVQRMASLSALFGFLSLYLYIRGRERLAGGGQWSDPGHLCWWGGALLAGTLAVCTKQNMAVLPLAIALFDYFYLPRPANRSWWTRERLLYLAPFFLPPLIIGLQQLIVPLAEGVPLQKISSTQEKGITPLYYLVTEFSVVWLYLRLLVFPYPQVFDYIYPITKELLNLQNVAAFFGLAGLVAGAFLGRRRYPHLSFGVFWFLLGIAVESTFIPLDPAFEHRLYLSMFGFAVGLLGAFNYFLPARAIIPLSLVCLLVFGGLTWRRNQMWNDDLALYLDNLQYVTPDAGFYTAVSKRLIERKRFSEAVEILTKVVADGTEKPSIYLNLASAYRMQGEPQKAIDVIRLATDRGIKYAKLQITLAQAYREIKDYEKSIEAYRLVLEESPDSELILSELGLTLALTGRLDEAEPYLRRALQMKPGNLPVRFNLARAVAKRGDLVEAEGLFRQVVSADPKKKEAWFALGVISLKTNNQEQYEEARKKLEQLDPQAAAKLASMRTTR